MVQIAAIADNRGYEIGSNVSLTDDGEFTEHVKFVSMKNRDMINLIITNDKSFMDKFVLATEVSKRLNLKRKEDRITVHKAILYGEVE